MATLKGAPDAHAAIVAAARSFLGVKFKHRGRDPRTGLDCAGMVVCSFRKAGMDPFDKLVYGREPFKDGLVEVVESNLGKPLPPNTTMQPGDVCVFRFSREPHHLGILGDYLHGGLSVIHAYGGVEKVVEHRLDDVWTSRICSTYRLQVD